MTQTAQISFADLRAFDPGWRHSGNEARFLCPVADACREKSPIDAHRTLYLNLSTGLWRCHRCSEQGQAKEYWKPRETASKGRKPLTAVRGLFQGTKALQRAQEAAAADAQRQHNEADWARRWREVDEDRLAGLDRDIECAQLAWEMFRYGLERNAA